MQKKRQVFVAILIIIAGIYHENAKGLQPRVFLAEPSFYMDEVCVGTDTVPAKTFVKMQPIKSTQLKEVQQPQNVKVTETKAELFTKAEQPAKVILTPSQKKDTALIRILYDGFKPKTKGNVADLIKIRRIIDSVVTIKDDPQTPTGSATPSYQDLVRIIDSLLKANKIDSNNKVNTDTPIVKNADSAINVIPEKKVSGQFMKRYWWLGVLAALILAGLAFFIIKRKRGSTGDSKIFFSYAWDQDEALIMQLYNSLKNDGFNVIKDKENIGYKGVISKFMNEIATADFVIVAISDKYLKSKFCMYELYEIFRNSGMNSDRFGKKIFPIRIDESLNLNDPDVVNGYIRYWKEQEQEWTKRVKDESDSITEEQARQYQFVKRLVIDIRNILSCLADINSLNLSTLKSNNFADVKSALRESMEAVG